MVVFLYLVIAVVVIISFSTNGTDLANTNFNKAIDTLSYQLQNPHLYALKLDESVETISSEEKVVYLTFDDGPSPRTGEILDILKEYNIKATFFVLQPQEEEYSEYLIRAADEGHSIGIHTSSHKYKEIYESVESYLLDFENAYSYIKTTTGLTPNIFRFPGGSVNNYNKDIINDLVKEMTRRGFVYFDWNVESNDSNENLSSNSIYNNVIEGVGEKERAIIIMHDSYTRKTTVEALDEIIKTLLEKGYVFKTLDETVDPIQFKLK